MEDADSDVQGHPHHPMREELLASPLSVYWVPDRMIERSHEGDQLMEDTHAVTIARKVLAHLEESLMTEGNPIAVAGVSEFIVNNWATIMDMSFRVSTFDDHNATKD